MISSVFNGPEPFLHDSGCDFSSRVCFLISLIHQQVSFPFQNEIIQTLSFKPKESLLLTLKIVMKVFEINKVRFLLHSRMT
jgi:hypothetical protein